MTQILTNALQTLNSFLAAGIAITAFSILLYALSFNLRDRVARSFALILVCVVIVFVSEAFSSVAPTQENLEFWLQLQWLGIIFLPVSYLHFSDALLATTGKPSRGRRKWAIRIILILSLGFLIALPTRQLVGPLISDNIPAPHLQRTWLTWVFALFYALAMLISWINFWRAYKRTVTTTSRRRMSYLIAGALAPALGSYPYLLFGSGLASKMPLIFWFMVTLSNLLVTFLLVLMAYAVAFFGVPWPDRVIKRRLLKWLMRGPVTASTVLVFTTILRRVGNQMGIDLSKIIPALMAASILLFEHLITLASPFWERWLFVGRDRSDLERLQSLDERLLTMEDLQQFLEAVLAAVCDRLQVSRAFIAILGSQGVEKLIMIGGEVSLEEEGISLSSLQTAANNSKSGNLFEWGDHWLVPLFDPDISSQDEMVGLLGVNRGQVQDLDEDQMEALNLLAHRAALAIGDRIRQEQAFSSLEELSPQMEVIQRLRAAARYAGTDILTSPEIPLEEIDLSPLIKDALTHYWGGPKLTASPLLNLWVVKKTAEMRKESPINALREILRKAIEHVRPEGERRFTAEWILYNILELKFMEGHKVREVAMRLAMSEADLYRKQRVAIEAVAQAILEMEHEAIHQANHTAADISITSIKTKS